MRISCIRFPVSSQQFAQIDWTSRLVVRPIIAGQLTKITQSSSDLPQCDRMCLAFYRDAWFNWKSWRVGFPLWCSWDIYPLRLSRWLRSGFCWFKMDEWVSIKCIKVLRHVNTHWTIKCLSRECCAFTTKKAGMR